MKHSIVPDYAGNMGQRRATIRCSCGWKATAKWGYRDSLVRRFTKHQEASK